MACPESEGGGRERTPTLGSSPGSLAEVGSLEHVTSSELFPKLQPQRLGSAAEEESPIPPFPLLPGESVSRYGRTSPDARVFLTTYRLFVLISPSAPPANAAAAASARGPPAFHDIPLPAIEAIEMRELFTLILTTKDGRLIRIPCDSNEDCLVWYKALATVAVGFEERGRIFAFAFRAWCLEESKKQRNSFLAPQAFSNHSVGGALGTRADFQRLGFDDRLWRIAEVNTNFDLCGSYPEHWIVPVWTSDDEVKKAATFRWLKRAPAVVWRDGRTGALLLRSAQPTPGLFSWRNSDDEGLLTAFAAAAALQPGKANPDVSIPAELDSAVAAQAKPLLVIDARSYAAAWANRAKGGGFESPEYYQRCQVQFMGLANIHAIRNSFAQLRQLLSADPAAPDDSPTWLQSLQSTQWLQHISLLLGAGVRAAEALAEEGRCVLVHCSDGWDRTPQITSLARLILDPHSRTLVGFRGLVERDWIEFGHKFEDRVGLLAGGNPSERCPVFLQFLDAVHQLLHQFPLAFQFNHAYLAKLLQHTYSGLFGTFLCNSVSDIVRGRVREQTLPLWALLAESQFHNLLYEPTDAPLWPKAAVHSLVLWRAVYAPRVLTRPRPRAPSTHGSLDRSLNRTHSCDSLNSESSLNAQNAGSNASATAMAASVAVSPQSNAQPPPRTGSDSNIPALIPPPPQLPPPPLIISPDSPEEESDEADGSHRTSEEPQELLAMDALQLNGSSERRESFTEDPLWAEEGKVASPGSSAPPSTISTSTSDISDSMVRRERGGRTATAGTKTRRKGLSDRRRRRRELTDWLDADGLPTYVDAVQERLGRLQREYQTRLEQMESHLQELRSQLRENKAAGPPCPSCSSNANHLTPTTNANVCLLSHPQRFHSPL